MIGMPIHLIKTSGASCANLVSGQGYAFIRRYALIRRGAGLSSYDRVGCAGPSLLSCCQWARVLGGSRKSVYEGVTDMHVTGQ